MDKFILQQWDVSDTEEEVYEADVEFDTLKDMTTYSDANSIPVNHQRGLLYKYDQRDGFLLYEHSVNKSDIPQKAKDFVKIQFFNAYSLDFNGIDYAVDFGDNYDFDINEAFTVSLWVKDNKEDAMQGFIGKKDGTFGTGWGCGTFADNSICFIVRSTPYVANPLDVGNAAMIKGLYAPVLGEWNHMLFTKDATANASGMKIFVNGKPITTVIAQDNLSGSSITEHPLRIGVADDGSSGFEGELTQVFIASKESTEAQALELYNEGTPLDMNKYSDFANVDSWWQLGNDDILPTISDSVGIVDGTVENITTKVATALPRRSIQRTLWVKNNAN